MKTGIHPNYQASVVVCACGNTFETRSTKPSMRIDLCNVCHPFYTGEQRIVDTAGQVERFLKKVETASTLTRPSKRQQRITVKSSRIEDDRRRAEEVARNAAAERAEKRKAAQAAEADAAALNALLATDEDAPSVEVAAAVEVAPIVEVVAEVEAVVEAEVPTEVVETTEEA